MWTSLKLVIAVFISCGLVWIINDVSSSYLKTHYIETCVKRGGSEKQCRATYEEYLKNPEYGDTKDLYR